MLASQLCVAGKLAVDPAAGVLLENLLKRADTYAPPSDPVSIYAPDRADLHDFVKGLGCKLQEVVTLDDALNAKTNPILVVSAAKANLEALQARKTAVDAYTQAGGWLMLWGLEPDGLVAYNTLLGTHHILREFRVESVHLLRDPLDIGLESPDVTMYSKDVIAPWSNLTRVSQDVFTYCVDGEDIAPFCYGITLNYKYQFNSAYNLVNGLTNADFWHYIYQIFYTAIPPEFELHTFKLPVACKLKDVKVWNNANYNTIQDFDLRVDGKSIAKAVLPDSFGMIDLPLNDIQANTSVGLYALTVRTHQPKPICGLDLVKILRELPDWYQGKVFPLTDNGGLLRYPRGNGGFVLNQLKLTDANVKDNLPKKQRIASTILQNLGAMFGEPEKVTNTPADASNPAALLDPSLWHKQQ